MPKKELTLQEKIAVIQQKLVVPKGQRNNFGKYNYRSNEDILIAVKPLLKEYEVLMLQTDEMVEIAGEVFIKATTTIWDGNNTVAISAFAKHAKVQPGMVDAQISGSTGSYARKYSASGLFLIDNHEHQESADPDSNDYTETIQKAEEEETAEQKWHSYIDKVIQACENEEDVAKALTTLNSLQGANLYKNYIEQKANERMNYLHGGK